MMMAKNAKDNIRVGDRNLVLMTSQVFVARKKKIKMQ